MTRVAKPALIVARDTVNNGGTLRRGAPVAVSPFHNCITSRPNMTSHWIILCYGGMGTSCVKVPKCSGLTLSLGLPPDPWGDPAALDWTRTNSSLVTVATDSVELLTFPSEELSSMAGWLTQSRLGRPRSNRSPSLFCPPSSVGGQPACTQTGCTGVHRWFWYCTKPSSHHGEGLLRWIKCRLSLQSCDFYTDSTSVWDWLNY